MWNIYRKHPHKPRLLQTLPFNSTSFTSTAAASAAARNALDRFPRTIQGASGAKTTVLICSRGTRLVSGSTSQKNSALVALHTANRVKYRQPTESMATLVICPISVLKAKLIMVARDTPLERVCVSKISAGMIQESGPQAKENDMLKSQVLVKPALVTYLSNGK